MFVDILMSKCVDPNQKTFIFPDNDFSAAAIDNHRNVLKEHFYCPHINERQGAVEEWMDKVKQKKLAQEVGLNVANYMVIEVKDKSFQIPQGINYPCFAKPLLSIVGGKSGLRKCDSELELRKHIESIMPKRDGISFLVEEFIQIEKEYATLGFSDGTNVIIPGMMELLHIGHGNHYGVAVQGKAFPTLGNEDIIDKFKTLVKEIGFVGVFDIDFFESKGKMYFCELNLRFGGSGFVFTKLGVNLPVMMMKYFLGENIDDLNKTIQGSANYFNERMALDDWYCGYISHEEYLNWRDTSDIKFVADDEDDQPQKEFEKEYKIRRIKKTLKKCLGKCLF